MTDAIHNIDANIVQIALDRVKGDPFERFAHEFLSAVRGKDFIPMGGTGDGGADGLLDNGTYEMTKRQNAFIQISVQKDHRSKIRQTVERIKEFGRDIETLVYVTSKSITNHDIEAEELSEELGVFIRINDGRYIETNINHSTHTIAAFSNHLSGTVAFLSKVGSAELILSSKQTPNTAVYVFLEQELERRSGKIGLVEAVADSLILWALEDTDPENNIFYSKQVIENTILEALPAAAKLLKGSIQDRLKFLASKDAGLRRIRYHKNEDAYCLPFEMRQVVQKENEEDQALRVKVKASFSKRISNDLSHDEASEMSDLIISIVFNVIYKIFETKGLEFCNFIQGRQEDLEAASISHLVVEEVESRNLISPKVSKTIEEAQILLGRVFYHSNEEERLFLTKLSRTYALLFSLQVEPRIVEYFQNMSGDFKLFVGTDLIVRALSEHHLPPEDRMTCNLLAMLTQAGTKLILSEPVLDEVFHYIEVSDNEYNHWYREIDQYMKPEIAQQSSRIIIRSYFYAKLDPASHHSFSKSWGAYLGNFLEYQEIRSEKGKLQLSKYLQSKFKMSYQSRDDLLALCNTEEVNELAKSLENSKKKKVLAENDALLVYSIYGSRVKCNETHSASIFGYRTWWLTNEAAIQRGTRKIEQKFGAPYLMRPEFLLNFISFAPSMATVKTTYQSIFPTLLGIRLSDRIEPKALTNMLGKAKDASNHDAARLAVKIGEVADQLKSDFKKSYTSNISDKHE